MADESEVIADAQIDAVDSVDSIMRICEGVEKRSNPSFLVQFYGVHEIADSYDNGNLLVSQSFRDALNETGRDKAVCLYFVFQDLRAIVGTGLVKRKEEEGEQEPYDISVNWTKLTSAPYSELGDSATADSIVAAIEDEEDMNWELKALSEEQAVLLENTIFLAAEESTESIRVQHEKITQSEQVADDNEEPSAEVTGADGPDGALNDSEGHGDAAPSSEGAHRGGREEHRGDHRGGERDHHEQRRVRSREPSMASGQASGMRDGYPEPKRSRIPFDVTKMSYDQYCAKHYSYAIEMYRQEKLMLFQQQQQAALMAGMTGGASAGVIPAAGAAAGATPIAAVTGPGGVPAGVPGTVPGAVPVVAAPAAVGVAPVYPVAGGMGMPGVPAGVPGMPHMGVGMGGMGYMGGVPGMGMMPGMNPMAGMGGYYGPQGGGMGGYK